MNEKIHNHVNILFAAAPKTQKVEETKEELLVNLNEKYEDLLKSGYDSTAAFHIALSGIGDPEELFKGCQDESDAGPQQEESSEVLQEPKDPIFSQEQVKKGFSTPLLVAVVCVLLALGSSMGIYSFSPNVGWLFRLPIWPLCWAVGIGIIAYLVVDYIINGKTRNLKKMEKKCEETIASLLATWKKNNHLESLPTFEIPSDLPNKKIAAAIFAVLLGWLGVHKFYLGFTGAGLIMLLITLLSFGVFAPISGLIGLIEGILYLTKSERDFYVDYVIRRKSWF